MPSDLHAESPHEMVPTYASSSFPLVALCLCGMMGRLMRMIELICLLVEVVVARGQNFILASERLSQPCHDNPVPSSPPVTFRAMTISTCVLFTRRGNQGSRHSTPALNQPMPLVSRVQSTSNERSRLIRMKLVMRCSKTPHGSAVLRQRRASYLAFLRRRRGGAGRLGISPHSFIFSLMSCNLVPPGRPTPHGDRSTALEQQYTSKKITPSNGLIPV